MSSLEEGARSIEKAQEGGMSRPGQNLVVSKCIRVWLIAGQALL